MIPSDRDQSRAAGEPARPRSNSRKYVVIIALVILVPAAVFLAAKYFYFTEPECIDNIVAEYGFVPIQPPSTLAQPGTWVTVSKEKPLQVGVLCPAESALGPGLDQRLLPSPSVEQQFTARLGSSYSLGAKALQQLKGKVAFKQVRNISFRLVNVRCVEIPDDLVFERLKQRTADCQQAIVLRMNLSEPVSMIKAVLIADMEYQVEFEKQLDAGSEAEIRKKLALELNLRLADTSGGTRRMVGKSLIWGVREDSRLARVGLALPPAGGRGPASVGGGEYHAEKSSGPPSTSAGGSSGEIGSGHRAESSGGIIPESGSGPPCASGSSSQSMSGSGPAPGGGGGGAPAVLAGKGAVTEIKMLDNRARDLPAKIAAYDVTPLRQGSAMDCWATVYAMMKSWKDKKPYPVNQVVSGLGEPWVDYYLEDRGLPAGKEKPFVQAAGLQTKPPANYTQAAYIQMLREHGPLWIITGDGISAHARLLVGIYGDAGAKTFQETTFEFIDPLTGTYRYQSGTEFADSFEAEARWLVSGNRDHLQFREQILFWP